VLRRLLCGWIIALFITSSALVEEVVVIAPAYPVPDYVSKLLEVAKSELGYQENPDGSTKYGVWYNDPYAEWCAEYLCWSVNETDQQYGTGLLKTVYPLYGATNIGLQWFLREGRYIARSGMVNGWGTQWLKETGERIQPNSYIPQPGDWVFFSYTPSGDTTHVAMVEYTSRKGDQVMVHVLEGNNPDKVQQSVYALNDWRILGYGTVHDLADITLRSGNEGKKVTELQQTLAEVGLFYKENISGRYDTRTIEAVRLFQNMKQLTETGIYNQVTSQELLLYLEEYRRTHNDAWIVDGAF
jgi:hypothetical protein